MRIINSFSIYFNLRAEKEKGGNAPIYAGITVNGQKVMLATKYWISIRYWDKIKGLDKSNTTEGREANEYLDSIRQSIRVIYQELQIQRKVITAGLIKPIFINNGENEHTLSEIAIYHNEMSAGILAKGTMKNYYTTQKYISVFVFKKHKRKEYFLSELNYKFIQDFEIFLRNHQSIDHQKPLTNNGIMKHLERFRKMINLAFRLEWISRDPFEKFKLKYNRVDKEFLSAQELESLESKQLTLPRLSMVRDIFVFCCYTGLSFADVTNLKSENICIGLDGGQWIRTFRQKTAIRVSVPLLSQAQF